MIVLRTFFKNPFRQISALLNCPIQIKHEVFCCVLNSFGEIAALLALAKLLSRPHQCVPSLENQLCLYAVTHAALLLLPPPPCSMWQSTAERFPVIGLPFLEMHGG